MKYTKEDFGRVVRAVDSLGEEKINSLTKGNLQYYAKDDYSVIEIGDVVIDSREGRSIEDIETAVLLISMVRKLESADSSISVNL